METLIIEGKYKNALHYSCCIFSYARSFNSDCLESNISYEAD